MDTVYTVCSVHCMHSLDALFKAVTDTVEIARGGDGQCADQSEIASPPPHFTDIDKNFAKYLY